MARSFNGLFAFTVDGFPIVGESEVKGFWTAIGPWVSFAGAIGRAVAEWMTHGEPGIDLRFADLQRFHPHQKTSEFIARQCAYLYEQAFDLAHPYQVASNIRNLRLAPYHARLVALDAEFVPFAGIETGFWYNANAELVEKYADRIPKRSGWEARHWSPIQGAEHLTLRENVALVDWTAAIGVIEVRGPGAAAFLNRLCSSDMDCPVGSLVYILLLTPRGAIKCDLTVARLAEDRYWLLTGKTNYPAELVWVRRHAPSDGSATVEDRSSYYAGVALWGPNARKVLQKVTAADASNEAFPYYTCREINVGLSPATALRLSYAGELGWEFYTPVEYGATLWDTLWEAGREFEMVACGVGALLSLRLEKGYRLWGTDMHTEHNPYETGMGRRVDFGKGDFVGREAVAAAKRAGLKRKLCCLTLDDSRAVLLGNEPIFAGGKCVGRVTSTNFGYSVGKFIAYGYLPIEYAMPGTAVTVEYTGHRWTATVAQEPLYDPHMKRLKG